MILIRQIVHIYLFFTKIDFLADIIESFIFKKFD